MVILKILITVLILLFPLGELGRINIYNEVSTTINDILVAVVIFVWLVRLILKNKFFEISKKQLAKPILFFIFFAFLSLLFNYNSLKPPEFLISFMYLLRFAFYAGIYFVISGFDLKYKRMIVVLIVISGTLMILLGFIQYFFYPNLRNLYYLGWDEHLYRLFGTFLDPNFAASIISLYLILVLSILLSGFNVFFKTRHSGPLRQSYSEASLTRVSHRCERFWMLRRSLITRMTQGIFLVLISIFSFIALLLTYSRSGYLMFFVSAVSLLLMLGKKKYVVILLLVLIIGIIILPKNLGGEGVKLLRTASIISRSEYLGNAITIFRDNPILGVGFNSYRYAQHRYGFIDDSSLRTSHAGAGTDNSLLFVLATTGIVGFVFYLYMWFKILNIAYYYKRHSGELSHVPSGTWPSDSRISNRGWRFWTSQNDGLEFQKLISAVVIASFAGLFVNSLFINSLFYPSIMLWMWILIGLNSSTGLRLRGCSDSRSSELKENS